MKNFDPYNSSYYLGKLQKVNKTIEDNFVDDLCTHLLNTSLGKDLLNGLYHVTWGVAVGNLGQRTCI